jgi:serine/threonine protein kinase, bacterial
MKTLSKIPAVLLLLALLSSCHKDKQPNVVIPPGLHTIAFVLAGNGNAGDKDGVDTAATFKFIWAIALDATGNAYVTDNGNIQIRKITPQGVVTTLEDNPNAGGSQAFSGADGMVIDAAGNFYVSYAPNNCIRKISPDGKTGAIFAGSTTGENGTADGTGTAARFSEPTGLAIDASGNIYVADAGNCEIRKITPAGVVTTLAGTDSIGFTDGPGTQAQFYGPFGVAVDKSGNVYVADSYNYAIRKITPDGTVSTVASGGTESGYGGGGGPPFFDIPTSIAIATDGTLYVTNYGDGVLKRISSDGVVSTIGSDIYLFTVISGPTDMVIDKSGTLYLANSGANQVWKIMPQSATEL